MLLIVLFLGFTFSIIPWLVFLILAPGPDNTKIYCISSVGCNKRCSRGQEYRRLNYKGWLCIISTSFIIIRKILIVVGIVVTI
jgi:hypothetical protein